MKRLNRGWGSSVSQSVSHGGVTDELTDPLRGGGEVGEGLAEAVAVLGGGVLLLVALADVGRAALLRAQAAADEAAAQRAAAEALVEIAQRDNATVNLIARSQVLTPALMWLAVLVVGLAVLAVVGLVGYSLYKRQKALAAAARYKAMTSMSQPALSYNGRLQELVLRENSEHVQNWHK